LGNQGRGKTFILSKIKQKAQERGVTGARKSKARLGGRMIYGGIKRQRKALSVPQAKERGLGLPEARGDRISEEGPKYGTVNLKGGKGSLKNHVGPTTFKRKETLKKEWWHERRESSARKKNGRPTGVQQEKRERKP